METGTHNYINYRNFSVRYDREQAALSIWHQRYGLILDKGALTAYTRDLNHVCQRVVLADFEEVTFFHEKHLDSNALVLCFTRGPAALPVVTLRMQLDNSRVRCYLDGTGDPGYRYVFSGGLHWGKDQRNSTFAVSTKARRGIRCALGPASLYGDDALFDRDTDTLLRIACSGFPRLRYDWSLSQYMAEIDLGQSTGMSFELWTEENVLADQFAIRYRPINKSGFYSAPPSGFMTWYALMWDTNEQRLLANVDVQARELMPYGADTIWVDYEWYHNNGHIGNERCHTFLPDPEKYPNGMAHVARYIKEKGLIPAIWIGATHDVSQNEYLASNPEILLLEKWSWCGIYFFDPTHPKFLDEFIPLVFRQLLDWGYKAIKWDALPLSLDYYDQYHDRLYDPGKNSEQALRGVVEKARQVVGNDVYMLSCHGEASRDITFAADLFDAARIGADVFSWENFMKSCVERVLKYYPMHNVVLYADPDNLVLREEFNTFRQAVSRTSFISLMGLPLTLGDDLTVLPCQRMRLIKRALPVLDIRPMRLAPTQLSEDCLFVILAVETPIHHYLVADLFNTTDHPVTVNLQAEDLGLDSHTQYHLFEYWSQSYCGLLHKEAAVQLLPHESKVFAVHKALDRPQLLSSSRHITQGAYDITALAWDEDGLILSGTANAVAGDEHRLFFHIPKGYKIKGSNAMEERGGILPILLDTRAGGAVDWRLEFEREGQE
ncbi:MAG: hypothetical protein LBS19_09640 [Clostridiales bacterium]|jgi:hypothetical protein|nr:hypothetical protein [Clostridiales bacterium]